MKKILILMFTMLLIAAAMCGCAPKDQAEPDPTLPPVTIDDTQEEFTKDLVPVTYAPGETAESLYYKTVVVDGNTCYEVQPADESEPMRVPVNETVIYGMEEDDCYIKYVHLTLSGEDGEAMEISQYQIYAKLENAVLTLPENNANAAGDNSSGISEGESADPAESVDASEAASDGAAAGEVAVDINSDTDANAADELSDSER